MNSSTLLKEIGLLYDSRSLCNESANFLFNSKQSCDKFLNDYSGYKDLIDGFFYIDEPDLPPGVPFVLIWDPLINKIADDIKQEKIKSILELI